MSKLRFTNTEKWRDPWFQGLSAVNKLLWLYLVDNCDNAGVWVVNMREAEFHLNEKIDWSSALPSFRGRIEILGETKWYIVKFISFQYPSGLSEKSAPHRQVLRVLKSHGLDHQGRIDGRIDGSLPCRLEGRAKDKDKDKEEDKGKEKVRDEMDILSPPDNPQIPDSSRWGAISMEPWARELKRAGAPIGRDYWTPWQALLDEFPLDFVLPVLKSAKSDKRWPSNIRDALIASRGQVNPGDAISPQRIHKMTL